MNLKKIKHNNKSYIVPEERKLFKNKNICKINKMNSEKNKRLQNINIFYFILTGFLLLLTAAFLFSGCLPAVRYNAATYETADKQINLSAISGRFGRSCCNRGFSNEEPDFADIATEAENYIKQKYDITDFEVRVVDYGCHIQ